MIENARKVQDQWLASDADPAGNPPGLEPDLGSDGKEKRRGPLLPEHLREAHKRHMLSDPGLVGQLGLWQQQNRSGVERFGLRVKGKRLFK